MPKASQTKRIKLPEESASRQRWSRRLFLVLTGLFAISFVVDAQTSTIVPQSCIWQNRTGLPCPFCGLIRSLLEISHGRFASALNYHLFGPVVYAGGLILLALSFYWWTSKGKAVPGLHLGWAAKWTALGLGLLWLGWWFWRMSNYLS